MEEALKRKKDMLNDIASMLSPLHNQKQKQKLNQMCKRTARKMFEERRVKRRLKTTQGNRRLLYSEDEEFVEKRIEDKAT